MASRGVGQHKSEAERAKDQLERQTLIVSKLEDKQAALDSQLAEIEQELNTEREMLAYYEQHPLLKMQDALPIELTKDPVTQDYEQAKTWKGFTERQVVSK